MAKPSDPPGTTRRALTRIEVSVILLVLGVAAWVLVPNMAGSQHVAEKRAACLENLHAIGQALGAYLEASDQRWPYVAKLRTFKTHEPPWPTLPEALGSHGPDDRTVFHCPADERVLGADSPLREHYPATTTYFATEGLSYEWLWGDGYGGHRIGDESLSKASGHGLGQADQSLLNDFEPFHVGDGGGSFNTLYADLHARTTRARADTDF